MALVSAGTALVKSGSLVGALPFFHFSSDSKRFASRSIANSHGAIFAFFQRGV